MSETPLISLDDMKADGRDASGRFTRGNVAAVTHGRRAHLERRDDLLPLHAAKVEAIVADLGGRAELSHLEMRHVEELARIELLLDGLGYDLLTKGPLSGKGRTRAAATLYLSVHDRFTRAASVIGLQRRQKALPDLQDYMRQGDRS